LPLLGFFQKGLCLASVDLLMLHCVCRLVVELEANRSAGHLLAGICEMRPAEESHSTLQQPQVGLPATHMQAQPQVHSKPGLCVCLLSQLWLCNLCQVVHADCLLMFVSAFQDVCNFIMAAWSNALMVGGVNACHLILDRRVLVASCSLACFRQSVCVSDIYLCNTCSHMIYFVSLL